MTANDIKAPNEHDDDSNGVLRRARLMTVFLVISSRRERGRREVDILLVVTFPQHNSDEEAEIIAALHSIFCVTRHS